MSGAVNTVEGWFGGDAMQKVNDQVGNDIKDSIAKQNVNVPVQPTLENSQAALDEAAAQQKKARGAAGTIFSSGNQDGGSVTSRMLLGS